MASVTPNTDVLILQDIPWDNSYNHLRSFASSTEQLSYFNSKVKWTVGTEFSYVRSEPGNPIRVGIAEADLINCNYLLFRNYDYSNKWICAFITEVRYISDGTTYIFFDIDWFQTWQFELQLNPCFVEREHVTDDTIGKNTVPEGLELGPLICENSVFNNMGGILYCIIATSDPTGELPSQAPTSIPSSLYRVSYTTPEGVMNAINTYVENGLEEAVVAFYMAPLGGSDDPGITRANITQSLTKPYSNIDGYAPKNNKLYVYPYKALIVSNNAGITNELRWELFPSQVNFRIASEAFTLPEAAAIPLNYKGQSVNFDESVTLKNFPSCSFSGDAFKAWWAQNQAGWITAQTIQGIQNGANIIGGLATSLGGFFTGNAVALSAGTSQLISGGTSALTQVAQATAQITDRKAVPDSARGTVQTSGLQFHNSKLGFSFLSMSISAEYAKIIDDFFSIYGYKINQIKVPNVKGRISFNYVKTIAANVHGAVPEYAKRNYEQCLNNGVWIWHVDDVGNFNLSNGVIT